jgi:hypothetical protein
MSPGRLEGVVFLDMLDMFQKVGLERRGLVAEMDDRRSIKVKNEEDGRERETQSRNVGA